MTHSQAFALVKEICPQHIGLLWNTTDHEGCDTAWAVADQYGDDASEVDSARRDLQLLAQGIKPDDWEAHNAYTLTALNFLREIEE